MVLSHRRVERVSDVRRGGIFDGPEHLGGGVLFRNCVERRGGVPDVRRSCQRRRCRRRCR
jgi:hypothetical protein